jgi:ATP-dependent DNA helicase RecQ
VCLGKLSQSASAKWRDKLDRVSEVRVVALVERRKTDEQDAYRSRIQAERWEVPVIEVVTA